MAPTRVDTRTLLDGSVSLQFQGYTPIAEPRAITANEDDIEVCSPEREILSVLIAEEPVLEVMRMHPEAITPIRRTSGAAGYDLHVYMNYKIGPGDRDLLSTGLAFAIPEGHYGRIAARSGSAWKKGIMIGAGVIDSDYRGEIKILVFNMTFEDLYIKPGEAVAQIIMERISTPQLTVVPCLESSIRGPKGFGSTSSSSHAIQIGTPAWDNLMKILAPPEQHAASKAKTIIKEPSYDDIDTSKAAWQSWLTEEHIMTLQNEWTNPFAEVGGSSDDEYFSVNSDEQTETEPGIP